jgi:signal transduction histidine kinase
MSMHATVLAARPTGWRLMLSWKRVRTVLFITVPIGLMIGSHWKSGPLAGLERTVLLGFITMLAFGLFEQWPKRLPRWLARWVLQVVMVAISIPPSTAMIYLLSTDSGAPPFYEEKERMEGFGMLVGLSLFIAPWAALAALVLQKEALARHQALAFTLERSELERQALDARMRLLQAQVAPHVLVNTLANVQALVDAGSPQASVVLQSLVAYLRAAVPRLNEPVTTLGNELELVRAYLELMHMRMPDRLRFELHVDEAARNLRCPPMTLLTLVENAVRHGIDPSEEGGAIEVRVVRRGDRCLVRVIDTGAGLGQKGKGLGTGLSTLRERLQLTFGGDVQLRVGAHEPKGVVADLDFPARLAA